jgi:hypothetical protein
MKHYIINTRLHKLSAEVINLYILEFTAKLSRTSFLHGRDDEFTHASGHMARARAFLENLMRTDCLEDKRVYRRIILQSVLKKFGVAVL